MFHTTCIAMPLQCHEFILQTNKKNYHPQVYYEERKCTDAQNQQCSMLGDSDDDDDDDDDDDGYFLA